MLRAGWVALGAGATLLPGSMPLPEAAVVQRLPTPVKVTADLTTSKPVAAIRPVLPLPAPSPPEQPEAAELAAFTPEVRIELPAPAEQEAPTPLVATVVDQPVVVAPPLQQATVEPPTDRLVDVAQLTPHTAPSPYIPQLLEPGLVAGGEVTLAAKIDAMQVPLPAPLILSDEERASLLAEAPSEMVVRVGSDAVGKVAFRMSDTGSIDVQLSGLLGLVTDRMAPEEYERLRGSSAADSYVPLDQLRAVGLTVRYDPVYDELKLTA